MRTYESTFSFLNSQGSKDIQRIKM